MTPSARCWRSWPCSRAAGLSRRRARWPRRTNGRRGGGPMELRKTRALHSLVHLDGTVDGSRPRMLETVREFVAERLAARPDVAEVEARHVAYYRSLAEQADRGLRGVGWSDWAERLEAEAGNLAAAVRWYLA